MPKILVVDDELSIRESFKLILSGKYDLLVAASGEAALTTIAGQKIDLIFLDIRMPGMNGLEALRKLKELDPEVEVVMVTAVNDVSKANEAIKHGSRDYIIKPFDVAAILKMTEQILRRKAIMAEGSRLKQQEQISLELAGQHDKMALVFKGIEQAKGKKRVLVVGEAGTEKDLVAKAIDPDFFSCSLAKRLSPKRIKRLLFGREQGSNTADLQAESGLLEKVAAGTVFIDNLEVLPEEVIGTLKSGRFTREGGATKVVFEGRLIGGSTQRLNSFADLIIELPPLRARTSDIPLLANNLLEQLNNCYNKEVKLEEAALEALTNYNWPGNTEELQLMLTRLVLAAKNPLIKAADLPLPILLKTGASGGSNFISDFEKEYIRQVLAATANQPDQAAAILGISPNVLAAKL